MQRSGMAPPAFDWFAAAVMRRMGEMIEGEAVLTNQTDGSRFGSGGGPVRAALLIQVFGSILINSRCLSNGPNGESQGS